jgi:transketolase
MRTAIIDEIYKIMKENKKAYFLIGDLGYHFTEEIEKDFPDRFLNIGVAEQNMIGIASGLALTGKKVYISTIIPFLIMRCFEQIRNDICYHNLDITLLGSGAGLTYGILSSTHFALEDIALMRSLPNMNIFAPADGTEAKLGIQELKNLNKPLYIRMSAREEPIIYDKSYKFKFGKGSIVKKGKDIILFVSGAIMGEVLEATKTLESQHGIKSEVVNIHSVKPIDKELVLKEIKNKKMIFTVEEHYKTGGLGSAVAEILSEIKDSPTLKIIGVENNFIHEVGTRSYLRQRLNLDSKGLVKTIINVLQ